MSALKMYVDGLNFRRIARLLSVSHQTVINWVNDAAQRLPAPPTPQQARRLPPVDTLKILPLQKSAPIYLPGDAWPDFSRSESVAALLGIDVIEEHEAVFQAMP